MILARFKSALGFFAVAVLLSSFSSQARAASMEIVPPARAWSDFLAHWEGFRLHLEKGETALAKQEMELCLTSKWDGALGDLPIQAIALVRLSEDLHRKGDPETAAWLIEMSEKLAPQSMAVQIALARYHLGAGPMDPKKSLGHYVQSVKTARGDLSSLFRILAFIHVYPIVVIGLFGLAFSVLMIFRYNTLLVHDFSDFFTSGAVSIWLIRALVAVILAIPVAAGLSFWWLIAWWLILFSIYMKRGERVIAYVWLLSLLATPWLVDRYCVYAGAGTDNILRASLRVRNGVPLPGDRMLLQEALDKNPEDSLVRFSLAQLLQREGRFNKAVSIYKPALKDPDTEQQAYNNLAEIYMWDRNLDTVFQALSQAASLGPPQTEIYFNLGQYYQEAESLLQMDEEYKTARSMDEPKFELLMAKAKEKKINRFMAGLPAPWHLFMERGTRGSALAAQASSGYWQTWMGQPSGMIFVAFLAGGLVLMFLLKIVSKRWQLSYRCSSCGKPICQRCQQGPSKDPTMCKPCFSVFRGTGGVDLQDKLSKRAQVQRYSDIRGRAGLAASLLLPGSGQFLLGGTGSGVFFGILSALLIGLFLARDLLWPNPGPVYRGGIPAHALAPVAAYVLLMLISVATYRSRVERWR